MNNNKNQPNKRDLKGQQQQKTRQNQGPKKQNPGNLKHHDHEHEHPETRLTR
jgi:hypothetical protein